MPEKSKEMAPEGQLALACPKARECGACSLVGVPYEQQLASKQHQLEQLFEGMAPAAAFLPIQGMESPFHFRTKVMSPFAPGRREAGGTRESREKMQGRAVPAVSGKGGKRAKNAGGRASILTGMYVKGTHRLVNTDGCPVEHEQANAVIVAIRRIMAAHGMEPYNEDAGTGFVRHAVVRVGHASGEMLVTLVTNGEEFTASKAFCRELVKQCPGVTTVVQNINTRATNVVLGDRERTLYGPGFILDTLCGLSFRISSRSFYQTNAMQTEVLYRTALRMAGLTGAETVIDAYCGTGTIGLVAAKGLPEAPEAHAARVVGVESVASAVRDAQLNARHNGIENAQFVCADAAEFMETHARGSAVAANGDVKGAFDPSNTVLMMDPPRAGASERFLAAACALAPSRIVYISCNPHTQVRDCRSLLKAGYAIRQIQAVDMFPHTDHMESVVLLVRK